MMLKQIDDKNIRNYWWVWLISICGISLIIKLYFLPLDLPPTMDGIDSLGYALEIRNSWELPINWPLANNGWPSFMGILFSILPSDSFFDFVNAYRVSNIIVSVITIIPIYFISAKFFGKYLGLLGASLIAFEPKLILNSTMINNESIFLLAISIVILLFFYKNFKTLAISFAIVAITSHIRYEALILLIPITILYFINYKNEKKYLIKYGLCIIIFLAVLVPFLFLNYSNTGDDGLTSHYTSAIIQDYDQYTKGDFSRNVYLNDTGEGNQNFIQITNGMQNLIKFFGISFFPFFILLIPFGIFSIFRKRDFRKKVIIILSIFMILPAAYAYLNGFNDVKYLFILYPIFSFLSLFSLEIVKNKINSPTILFIGIMVILILIGFYMNFEEKEQIDESREFFFVSQKVVDIVMTYNQFSPASQYIKSAEMENRWPNGSMATQSGHVVKERTLINYSESKTLKEFIENSRDNPVFGQRDLTVDVVRSHPHHQFWFTDSSGTRLLDPFYYFPDGTKKETYIGLSHLIVDDRDDRPDYIQDIYHNENKYSFLIKKFDSLDFNLKYNVKIFEIDYEKFYQIYN